MASLGHQLIFEARRAIDMLIFANNQWLIDYIIELATAFDALYFEFTDIFFREESLVIVG
jgi:hypothetical protein